MPHIVDVLIEERAQRLSQNKLAWWAVKTFFYPVLGYRRAVELVDLVQPMTGFEIFQHLSEKLRLNVEVAGAENIPRKGRAILTPNHPAGMADGVAVFDAVKDVREDVVFFANRDAVRAAPTLTDIIIPVEWDDARRGHATNKETVRHMVRAFRDQKLVVFFPSGRLARPTLKGLVEREWTTTAVNLAQKYDCPIVPMHIEGRNSLLYYLLFTINTELKDITLFRELLNREGKRYSIQIGQSIDALGNADDLTKAIRAFVADAMPRGARQFQPLSNG
jgi:putative hemolysin